MSLAGNIILVVTVIVLSVGGYYGNYYADLGAGYTAKIACSGVFISKRTLGAIEEEEFSFIVIPVFSLKLNMNSVTSNAFFGLYSRTAFYDPSSNTCALAGHGSDALKHTKSKALSSNAKSSPLESVTNLEGINYDNLRTLLDAAFHEPFVKEAGFHRRSRAIIIVRDGKILKEEYSEKELKNTPLASWGLTEALFSSIVGKRVQEGKLSLSTSNLFPEWRNDKRSKITIGDLLFGTSGLWMDFSHHYNMVYQADSAAEYAIAHASLKENVDHFPAGANLLSRLLRESFATQEEYWKYVRDFLDQLGLKDTVIETDSVGDFVPSTLGLGSASDWIRYGLFVSSKGKTLSGEQILPASWFDDLLTPRDQKQARVQGGFHLNRSLQGHKLFDSLPEDAIFALGEEGQSLSIIPSQKLVVVRLGSTQPRKAWNLEGFLDYLLQNVIL